MGLKIADAESDNELLRVKELESGMYKGQGRPHHALEPLS